MGKTDTLTLPITITPDGITVDDQVLSITKENAFLTKHLKKYYLSSSSVYQKIIYKTYWIEEKTPGPLSKMSMKVKVTMLFPDIIGIEYAKTKTVYSMVHPRFLEVLQGSGMLLLQHDTDSLLDESTAFIVNLAQGQKAVIPPNWHYTLINSSNETLVTLELYRCEQELHNCSCTKKGSGIYVIERNGVPEIVKNSQYKNLVNYATVDPESYATTFKLSPTKPLTSQMDCILNNCDNPSDVNWEQRLDSAHVSLSRF